MNDSRRISAAPPEARMDYERFTRNFRRPARTSNVRAVFTKSSGLNAGVCGLSGNTASEPDFNIEEMAFMLNELPSSQPGWALKT
jgi:hypothetical protein